MQSLLQKEYQMKKRILPNYIYIKLLGEPRNHQAQHAIGLARQLCANILKVLASISPILGVARVKSGSQDITKDLLWGIVLRLLYKDTLEDVFAYIYVYLYMRVEQKVHERGFLCVSLWVCNEQSRLKFCLKWRKKRIGYSFGERLCIL